MGLEPVEAIVQHLATLFLVQRNAAGEAEPGMDGQRFVLDQWREHSLFTLLARNVGTHVPGVCDREQRLVAELLNILVPVFFALARSVEIGHILLASLGQRVDDPVALAFDTRWAVAECSRALCAIYCRQIVSNT